MLVKEVARLVNISVRTLHHYDAIGLLSPEVLNNGYRIYSDKDLEKLQQILFFKELGFPLKQIKSLLDSPHYDRLEALELQRKALLKRQERTEMMLNTIGKTIKQAKGELEMTKEESFQGFDFGNNPYETEARRRFGDEAVDESNKKIRAMDQKEKDVLSNEMINIFMKLAKVRMESPEDDVVQELVSEWYRYLNTIGTYSLEAFAGLGALYVADERFTQNIDQYGSGLAQFMCDAMHVYAEKHK